MESKIKKISIVVYCNGDFQKTKQTLYSLIDQNISHLFFDVFILSDNANKNFSQKLNDFIKKEELINYHIFSFDYWTGLPLTFSFLLKNNIIKTTYTTIVKSGDTLADGWLEYFLNNLYPMKYDLYMTDLKDELYIPKDNIENDGKDFSISKSRIIITPTPSGELSQNEAICTKPILLGKIWKTKNIRNIKLDNDRILYQDIFMYIQMILFSQKIWYENKYSGTVRRKPLFPKTMDPKRIELFSITLNKMISRHPFVNGHVLQLLALALEKTQKENQKLYLLSNYKYLQDNFEIVPIYNLSKRKVVKLTRPFVEQGEIKVE